MSQEILKHTQDTSFWMFQKENRPQRETDPFCKDSKFHWKEYSRQDTLPAHWLTLAKETVRE